MLKKFCSNRRVRHSERGSTIVQGGILLATLVVTGFVGFSNPMVQQALSTDEATSSQALTSVMSASSANMFTVRDDGTTNINWAALDGEFTNIQQAIKDHGSTKQECVTLLLTGLSSDGSTFDCSGTTVLTQPVSYGPLADFNCSSNPVDTLCFSEADKQYSGGPCIEAKLCVYNPLQVGKNVVLTPTDI